MRDDPDNPQAAFILALCLMRGGQFEAAYHVTRSVAGYVDLPQITHNLAHCLAEMGVMPQAKALFHKSIAKNPTPEGWSSLASVHAKLGEWPDAVAAAEEALKLDPKHRDAKWNASRAMLALRRWRPGWEWWDETIGTKMRPIPKWLGTDLKPWNGEPDAILLITGEQGLGDEIMFASMIPDVLKTIGDPGRVYLASDKRLVGLFARSFGVHTVDRAAEGLLLRNGMKPPTHHIMLGSLGRIYRLADDAFPGKP